MTDIKPDEQEKVICWSKKLPKKPGYYWVRKREYVLHRDKKGYWTLRVFHVFIDVVHNVLSVEEHGDDGWYNLDEYGNEYQWLGPLIEPPIDAEAG